MRRGESGFTYLILIITVAILSIGLAAVGTIWASEARHQRIVQTHWAGEEYRKAIGSYYEASPGSVKIYPPTVNDLLQDKRYLYVRRHLREPYPNLMEKEGNWQIIRGPDGGILGVSAKADDGAPLNFVYQPLH